MNGWEFNSSQQLGGKVFSCKSSEKPGGYWATHEAPQPLSLGRVGFCTGTRTGWGEETPVPSPAQEQQPLWGLPTAWPSGSLLGKLLSPPQLPMVCLICAWHAIGASKMLINWTNGQRVQTGGESESFTMESYSAIKRNEVLTQATTYMNLKIMTKSEVGKPFL